jgi:uncharacterized protein YkwD
MNRIRVSSQHVIAALVLAAACSSLSLFAESRPPEETEMQKMAHELEAAIARSRGDEPDQTTVESVEVEVVRGSDSPSVLRDALDQQELLDEMNAYRERYGLSPLALNRRLSLAAADRVTDMFEHRYFAHVAPDGTQPFTWADSRGYRYTAIGENLAMGQKSAREVVSAWMHSPGHRRNILGSSYVDCGLAIERGSPTGGSNGYTFVALYGKESP